MNLNYSRENKQKTTNIKYGYIFGECSGCSFVYQKEILLKVRFITFALIKNPVIGGKLIIKININGFVLPYQFLPT